MAEEVNGKVMIDLQEMKDRIKKNEDDAKKVKE